jgi:hypothetical protein
VVPDGDAVAVVGRARRRRPLSQAGLLYAFAAFLLVVATVVAVVGMHDTAVGSGGLTGSLGSIALLGVAVLVLVSVWELIVMGRDPAWRGDDRPPCKPIVLIGLLLTSLLGLYVVLAAIRRVSAQWPVVAFAGVVLIGVPLFGLRFFGSQARITLPRAGAIIFGLIGTILGAWEFWYQHEYVPSRAGGAVALKRGSGGVGDLPGLHGRACVGPGREFRCGGRLHDRFDLYADRLARRSLRSPGDGDSRWRLFQRLHHRSPAEPVHGRRLGGPARHRPRGG